MNIGSSIQLDTVVMSWSNEMGNTVQFVVCVPCSTSATSFSRRQCVGFLKSNWKLAFLVVLIPVKTCVAEPTDDPSCRYAGSSVFWPPR